MMSREPAPAPDLTVGGVTVPGEERTRVEVWSRVMGYMRPVSQWNEGKQSEWHERVTFRETAQDALEV
jgi:hypothetical protein